ncbi:rhodanese-like domain-containing protein [soil metagenome]
MTSTIDLTPEQALELLRNGTIRHVIDTREPHEWEAQRIAGSVIVPVPSGEAQVLARLQALDLPRNEPVLVHCRSGARSARVMPQVQAYGFETIYHLPGGMLGWAQAGMPTTSGPAQPGESLS